MAVFGWLCIVAIAVMISCLAASISFGSVMMSRELGAECWVFVVVAAILWVIVWWLAPFHIVVQ